MYEWIVLGSPRITTTKRANATVIAVLIVVMAMAAVSVVVMAKPVVVEKERLLPVVDRL